MTEQPKHGGWGALIAAKLVCCGGLLLFATGVLTVNGMSAWLLDGVVVWLAAAAIAAVALLLWLRRRPRGVASAAPQDAVYGNRRRPET